MSGPRVGRPACAPRALTGGQSRSLNVTHVQHGDPLTWGDARNRRSRTWPEGPYKAEVAGSRPAAPTHEEAGQRLLLGVTFAGGDACAAPRALRMP
jgi:hypothetical protein